MEKEDGICTHEKTVKPVEMDTATDGVLVSANGDGINGDHAVSGTNGVKESSSIRIDLADTSLPPAAIKVSFDFDLSGVCVPKVVPITDRGSHRAACDGPV